MAMRGKNCVAIAADRRFGIQAQMVTTDFQKIFPMGDRLYIGLAGLATDVQTVWVSFWSLNCGWLAEQIDTICHMYKKQINKNKMGLWLTN